MIKIEKKMLELFSEVSGMPVNLKTKIDSLNLDSLDILELLMKLKNELNIEVTVDEFILIDTIEALLTKTKLKSQD